MDDGRLLLARLRASLPPPARRPLARATRLAEEHGAPLYLVGGGVRDLLLGRAHVDLDLVVEGDAIALAEALAGDLPARLVTHPRFRTAALQGERFRLDLARARSERYGRPGALPSVRPGSLADDLARRDFTVNAMALRLSRPGAGELTDPRGGRDDLRRRLVRALHDASFRDDATRILRALRYTGRLGFRLAPATAKFLRRDLPYLDTISGARLRHELERIAAEERAADIVRLARRYGALEAMHPALRVDRRAMRGLSRLGEVIPAHREAVLFCLLLADASANEAESAIDRLALTGAQASAVRAFVALRAVERDLSQPSLSPSGAVRLLKDRPPQAIEAFALWTGRRLASERARTYLAEWRHLRPRLSGHDVQALGVPRGPQIGAALSTLRESRLNGRTKSRRDEASLVRRLRRDAASTTGGRRG